MDEGPRGWGAPLHEQVLAGLEPGSLLDVGCGAGTFAALAAGRGWTVAGTDVDRAALAAAERALPGADLRLADAHDLPWPDGTFGLVALVQLLAHLTNPVAALREAARVCAPGGRVRATVWGREDECDAREFGRALAPFLPGGAAPGPAGSGAAGPVSTGPRASGGPRGAAPSGPPPLTEPARLRKVAGLAGLEALGLDEVVCTFVYDDADELTGPLLGSGLGRAATRTADPRTVRRALLDGLEPFREGRAYRLRNTFRVLDAVPAA